MSQHVVLATLDAGGNVPPVLGIGRELSRAGHRVTVIGHPQQQEQVEGAGLDFEAYSRARPWSPTSKKSTLGGLLELVAIFNDRGLGRDVVDLATREHADVVVVDCMLLGALAEVRRAGLVHATLFHTLYAYFDGPWRRGPVGLLSRLRGNSAARLWTAADCALVATDPALDPASSRDPRRGLTWSGAVVETPRPAVRTQPPRVLVSLSTTAFPGMQTTLQHILDGLEDLPLDVVVTTGPAIDPATLRTPGNATVSRYVDHDELMPSCSAVVGHGGHATTTRALAHDLPILVIPAHPMLDQPMVGKVVTTTGVGLTLDRKATPADIGAAVQTLLTSPAHRDAAAAMGARIRAAEGARTAAGRLLALTSPAAPQA